MAAARPSESLMVRALRAAHAEGHKVRAMDVLPDGTLRLLFEDPVPVPSSSSSDEAESKWDARAGTKQ